MAYSNIVLQPALHVWTCLNVYIVKHTFPWDQDLAINAPQVIPQSRAGHVLRSWG